MCGRSPGSACTEPLENTLRDVSRNPGSLIDEDPSVSSTVHSSNVFWPIINQQRALWSLNARCLCDGLHVGHLNFGYVGNKSVVHKPRVRTIVVLPSSQACRQSIWLLAICLLPRGVDGDVRPKATC